MRGWIFTTVKHAWNIQGTRETNVWSRKCSIKWHRRSATGATKSSFPGQPDWNVNRIPINSSRTASQWPLLRCSYKFLPVTWIKWVTAAPFWPYSFIFQFPCSFEYLNCSGYWRSQNCAHKLGCALTSHFHTQCWLQTLWVVLDLAATWLCQWSGASVHLSGNQGYHETYIRSFSKATGSLKLGKNGH